MSRPRSARTRSTPSCRSARFGSPITADAISAATRGSEQPKFLAIGAAEAIAERNPIYESTEIKAGAFGGSPPRPEESVETIGVNHYIVARRKLSEHAVADFTKHLFAIRQSLTAELPSAAKIEKPDTDKDAAVPVHPGAAAYLDGELKTFFDRYSDLLYWGLMVFSFFGSAIAGLLSYNKADDRVRRLGALEKLLEITKSARTAATLQAVDELQVGLDSIQSDMIHEVEANTLDETAMMAFAVSFEQARACDFRPARDAAQQPRPSLAAVAAHAILSICRRVAPVPQISAATDLPGLLPACIKSLMAAGADSDRNGRDA